VGFATGPVGVAETDELLLDVVTLLLELEETRLEEVRLEDVRLEDVRLAEVEDVDDATDKLEDPVEAEDEVAELEEPVDLFCTVANVVPTKVALLLRSMVL
jgi:hypothetical protein